MAVEIYKAEPIEIRPQAAEHIKRYMEKNNAAGMFLRLKKAGCSGLKYDPKPATQADLENPANKIFVQNGSILVVELKDMQSFSGMKIDYISEGLNKHLVYINQHAENACGCGESFSLKKEK